MAEDAVCPKHNDAVPVASSSQEYDLDVASASSPVLVRSLSDAIVRSIVESDEWPSFVEVFRNVGDDDFDNLPCKPTSKQYASWTRSFPEMKNGVLWSECSLPGITEDKRRAVPAARYLTCNRHKKNSARASADLSNADDAFRQTETNCRSARSPCSEARYRSAACTTSSNSGSQQRAKPSVKMFTSGTRASETASPPFKKSKSSLLSGSPVSGSTEWSSDVEQFRAALLSSGSSGDCDLAKSAFHIAQSGSSIVALEQLFLAADQARKLHDELLSPVAARTVKRPAKAEEPQSGGSRRSLRRLGRGAFGRVFGVHIKGRLVAVKDVRNVDSPCEKNASQLVHRHVVRTLYVTSLEPRRFLVVMEYGGPRTLQNILDQGPLRLQDSLRFGRQTASALHYCHRCNVLHLDVKPSNILVHNADCKLADFGSSAARGTKPKVCGTVQYMSPEVLCGQRPDFSSDVYSLGVVLWQMQSGVRPFDGLHQHAIIFQVVRQQARPQFGANTVPEIEALVTRCWSTSPQSRPSVGAVVQDLTALHRAHLMARTNPV